MFSSELVGHQDGDTSSEEDDTREEYGPDELSNPLWEREPATLFPIR